MKKEFKPVEILYGKSMYPLFMAAIDSINEDGILTEGIKIEEVGEHCKIAITIEQKEQFLIQLGIRVGKQVKKYT